MTTPTPLRLRVNRHKALSDIERDIRSYYAAKPGDVNRDTELTTLKIAARALSLALDLVEPVNVAPVTEARAQVFALVRNRLAELERRRAEETGGVCGAMSGLQVCDRPAGHEGPHGCYLSAGSTLAAVGGARRASWRGEPQAEPLNWCCTYCQTSNGAADRRCVNCGRRDL